MSIAKKILFGSIIGSGIFIFATAIFVATVGYNISESFLKQQSENQLVSLRDVQKTQLNEYFSGIKKQVITYSNNDMIITAMQYFARTYSGFEKSAKKKDYDFDAVSSALSNYYRQDYQQAYKLKNSVDSRYNDRLFSKLDSNTIYAQYLYINENPYDAGQTDKLVDVPLRSSYTQTHARFHPFIQQYLRQFGYADILLIDSQTGTVVYSALKEVDFGTSLLNGSFSESELAKIFKEVSTSSERDSVKFSPFSPYQPSYNDPMSFIASPIFNNAGENIGVLAFKMDIHKINKLMGHNKKWLEHGLGNTGETYLVSSDMKLQSLSREYTEKPDKYIEALKSNNEPKEVIDQITAKKTAISYQQIKTPGVKRALAGNTGFDSFLNYKNEEILSAYTPIEFEGHKFALLSEISSDEAFAFSGKIISSVSFSVFGIAVLILSIVAYIALRASKELAKSLQAAVDVSEVVSTGKRAEIQGVDRDDEIGALMRSLDKMQSELIVGFENREKVNIRITKALDVANTNMMLVDGGFEIIYINDSLQQLFNKISADLEKSTGINLKNSLIGESLVIFGALKSLDIESLKALSSRVLHEQIIGSRTIQVIANPVFGEEGDRIGTVIEWIDITEELASRKEERLVANANAQIKEALDNVSSNVMLANQESKIIYLNKALQKTVNSLLNVEPESLIGTELTQFYSSSELQSAIVSRHETTYRNEAIINNRHINLAVNSIINSQNEVIGTVVEWDDKTTEKEIENEIDNLVASAAKGDLSIRINSPGISGFFDKLVSGLNNLLDINSNFSNDIGSMLTNMAKGDLTKVITTSYSGQFERIKDDANESLRKLGQVLTEIISVSNSVSNDSTQVTKGSQDLSKRTEQQAALLAEASLQMEEINGIVVRSFESTSKATDYTKQAQIKARNGGEVVKKAIDAMNEILLASNKINDIIGVIDEISFQTNLLALNAAVEAARAGENGRGFAVVAAEVRSLSQRSANAAKEIKTLIQDSVKKVDIGSDYVNQSGATLTEIVASVEEVANIIEEVNSSAREQATAIKTINQSISSIGNMTKQNAVLVDDTNASCNSMNSKSKSMTEMVSFFKINY